MVPIHTLPDNTADSYACALATPNRKNAVGLDEIAEHHLSAHRQLQTPFSVPDSVRRENLVLRPQSSNA